MGDALERTKELAVGIKKRLVGSEACVVKAQGYLDGSHPLALLAVLVILNAVLLLLGRFLTVYHVLIVAVLVSALRGVIGRLLKLVVKILPNLKPVEEYSIDQVAAFLATSGWYLQTFASERRGTKWFAFMLRVFVLTLVFYVVSSLTDEVIFVGAVNGVLLIPLIFGVDWDAHVEKVSDRVASIWKGVAERTAPLRKSITDQVTALWEKVQAKLRAAKPAVAAE